ncbi:probable protein S-acyltransferase 7 [Hibiscus syriacus]|uniref:probable protein S-acyltransferase 7 n=1 Tax=Hibiscus syriacus TaxID=106335 RepID=UPI00192237F0|nr:probable protein S-acyltransferase 7 [Hibiscus syriacus]
MYRTPFPAQFSDSHRRVIDHNPSPVRLYQVWKGSNKFFLGGRVIFGPDVRSIFLTISLIVIPVVLFCAFVSRRIISAFDHHLGDLIVAVLILLTIYDLILLLLTSGRDPGIIPRNSHPPEPEEDYSTMSTDWLGSQSSSGVPNLPPTKDVVVNGVIVKVKYCRTCMLYRPPRCSHCSICNNCIERFDHHCPWVGQCIGKRNYRFFFMFVFSTTVLCLYVFVFCWINVKKIMADYHCNLWSAFVKSPVSAILILYTFMTAWFVGGLTVFHLYLIFTNQTTYENFRYRYDSKRNPYNRGCVHNIFEVFLSKIPESKSNFREKVKVDSYSLIGSSLSFRPMTADRPKRSFDIEMRKRQTVVAEDFEEISNRNDRVGVLERCGTEPRHTMQSDKSDWDMSPDISVLAADFAMEYSFNDRKSIKRATETGFT